MARDLQKMIDDIREEQANSGEKHTPNSNYILIELLQRQTEKFDNRFFYLMSMTILELIGIVVVLFQMNIGG